MLRRYLLRKNNAGPTTSKTIQDIQLLRQWVDKVEDYAEYDQADAGLDSLKNMGIWLLTYALAENKDCVFGKFKTLAGVPNSQAAELREAIDRLATKENIESIIGDYQKAGGTLEIGVAPPYKAQVYAIVKSKFSGLARYITDDPKDCVLLLTQENTIHF